MNRVCIIGASGSGKTTLARRLGARLGVVAIDLDDLHWLPGWQARPLNEMRTAVDGVTRGERWVIAGNYAAVRDLLWPRADTLIWLDLPMSEVLWRATRRALRQWWTNEPICNGNRQGLRQIVNGRESLLGYTLMTYHARRRDWPAQLEAPMHAHLTVIRLHTQGEIDAWCARQVGNTPVDR